MLAAVRTLFAVSALSLALFVPSSAVAETEAPSEGASLAAEMASAIETANEIGQLGIIEVDREWRNVRLTTGEVKTMLRSIGNHANRIVQLTEGSGHA